MAFRLVIFVSLVISAKYERFKRDRKRSIIELVQEIIVGAYRAGASDVHLDPQVNCLYLRYRIDGLLKHITNLDVGYSSEVISRIKVLSGLRTDEHQTPQDGRFRLENESLFLDIRVSVMPTYYGENAVLRLLADRAEDISLDSLGFTEQHAGKLLTAIKKPHGLILATGPTGSGKTSTLYSLLKILNLPETSIVTIEDPIEYALEGAKQIQVNSRRGLGFAQGLRSILRQDPNIVMVGEIRDSETAGIAVNAALTGHLVLSTLHTNDAATTLPRLLDMKIEPFLIASTVSLVISQRLVRKICQHCKRLKEISYPEMESLWEVLSSEFLKGQTIFYYGEGCLECGYTGYRGRVGIQEVLVPDEKIREAILLKSQSTEIKKLAGQNGMTTILQDGLLKAQSGLTTIEEVLRVFYE